MFKRWEIKQYGDSFLWRQGNHLKNIANCLRKLSCKNNVRHSTKTIDSYKDNLIMSNNNNFHPHLLYKWTNRHQKCYEAHLKTPTLFSYFRHQMLLYQGFPHFTWAGRPGILTVYTAKVYFATHFFSYPSATTTPSLIDQLVDNDPSLYASCTHSRTGHREDRGVSRWPGRGLPHTG